MITIIDYGRGNLRSVVNALKTAGASARLAVRPSDLEGASALVLPGVGSFGDCVESLRRQELWRPILDWLKAGRPYLGICLGYQVLFESSEESPDAEGLGFFKGRVTRFPASELKVPHMGWNLLKTSGSPFWKGLSPEAGFYFVHSYYPVPEDPDAVAAVTEYGVPFASAVAGENLLATQFHPEKSQEAGQKLLRNFLDQLP